MNNGSIKNSCLAVEVNIAEYIDITSRITTEQGGEVTHIGGTLVVEEGGAGLFDKL